MTIYKGGCLRLIYTIFISVLIYTFCTTIVFDEAIVVTSLFLSIALGIGIWFFAEILFYLSQRIWPNNNLVSYIVLAMLIGLGTYFGSTYIGVRDIRILAFIIVFAQIFGLGIAFINQYYYKKKLNKSLQIFKEQ